MTVMDVVAGPVGYLPALVAVWMLVDHVVVHERRLHGAPPAGRRLDIRAIVTATAVLIAMIVLAIRMLALIN